MENEDLLGQALSIIEQSDLSAEDKDLWHHHLTLVSQEKLSLFVANMQNDMELLDLTTNSLRKKVAAKNDTDAFKKIVDEEVEEITQLMQ